MEGTRSAALTGGWDTRISRRVLLRTGGSAAAGLLLLGRTPAARAVPPFQGDPFRLGVASGDPTPEGFVLWTRLCPSDLPLDGSGLSAEPYGVRYEIGADPDFHQIVRRGAEEALPDEVHSVHAEVGGLQPATDYWYRFKWGTAVSAVGRARTAPAPGTAPEPLRFAFASCQNRPTGWYPAYADLAAQDLDLVVHLGDYIYEGATPATRLPGRENAPMTKCLSLADFRTRHAQYKTDPDLQLAHASHPWLPTWDDHEFDNNYADLDVDPDEPLETVAERRAAAYLAYWEHMPLSRTRKPVGKDMNLYRRLHWGALATFHVLDTRQHRSDQTSCTITERTPSGYCPGALDAGRSLLGQQQRDWLHEGLAQRANEGWNVLANQVGFAPEDITPRLDRLGFGFDSWDGYAASRQSLLDFIADQSLTNVVVITGDKHFSSVRHVPPNYQSFLGDPVATEFIGTSISSGGDLTQGGPPDGNNPHHLWNDYRRGYVKVQADADLWRAEFRVVDTVAQRDAPAHTASTWVVERGKPRATRVNAAV